MNPTLSPTTIAPLGAVVRVALAVPAPAAPLDARPVQRCSADPSAFHSELQKHGYGAHGYDFVRVFDVAAESHKVNAYRVAHLAP